MRKHANENEDLKMFECRLIDFEMYASFKFLEELFVILEVNWMSLAHLCGIKHGGILLPV